MRSSIAFLDLGYTHSDQPRRPRGGASIPVHHPKEAADRSPAAAALRVMRRQLDQADGRLTDGTRATDDPFARRQLMDAYERLKSALAVYNTFAVDLDVPAARVLIGDAELALPVSIPEKRQIDAKAANRPATPFVEETGVRASAEPCDALTQAEIEQARAAFFARGGAK